MEQQMTLETNFPTSKGWGLLLENQTIRIFPIFRATQATTSINMGQQNLVWPSINAERLIFFLQKSI
jgi:hypothetical protein